MTEQSMPKDERADALLVLKKLLENNPDADPYGIKEAWLEIVWKDELLREAVFGEVFDDLWKQGARTLEEMRELLRKLTSTTVGREPNTAPDNCHETTDELFQLVKPIMDKAQMSDQGKAFVLNSLRTSEQVPEITSEEQYELYSKLERELSAQLPDRDDPTYGKAFLTRSPAGVLANVYAAKSKSAEEMELPNQTCALIPISNVFERVSSKLSELLR
jgi:hypothetical protein